MMLHFTSNGRKNGFGLFWSFFDFFFPYRKNGNFHFIRCEASTVVSWDQGVTERNFYTFRAFLVHYVYTIFINPFKGVNPFGIAPWRYAQAGAIGADASATATQVGAGSTSLTWAQTCTGSNLILFAGLAGGSDPSGVTYNSVALTEDRHISIAQNGHTDIWRITGPSTGANNVVASFTSADMAGISASYSGAKQSAQPDATSQNNGSGVGTWTDSVTTIADNCWVIFMANSNQATAPAAGTNTTSRGSNAGGVTSRSCILADNNAAKTPAGSVTLEATDVAGFWADVIASFSPAPAGAAAAHNLSLIGAGN